MPTKDLTFRLFGQDITATSSLSKLAAEGDATSKSLKAAFGKVPAVIAVAGLAAAGVAVKMAADFQDTTTKLVTGAGESEKNIEKVRQGLLDMAPAVGMGPKALADAMFMVESAGFHGAAGLQVMKAAAEGAKVGGADAKVVANGLTTALTDYHLPASQAASITSKLVETVASGKTTMQDLSGALSAVLPSASKAGIGLNQVLGAMATMTGEGISAQQSSQDLASSIAALENPSTVQTQAMAQMGLTSTDVAQKLGSKGLTGTMMDLSQSIMSHMGPSGLVLQSSFNQSKLAAQSAQQMLTQMPPSLQKLGQEFLNNQITQKQWRAAMQGQPVLVSNLGKQFAATAKEADGFSARLKSGQGPASTFNSIMANMTGGQSGLSTALALTGNNMGTFQSNVKNISAASADAHGHVKGWAETQKDFNTQLAQAGAAVQVMAIKMGNLLMPAVQGIVKGFSGAVGWLTQNKTAFAALATTIGVVVGVFTALAVAQKMMAAVSTAVRIVTIASAAAQWVLNAALSANPIGIIITVLAALVGALIWFFTQTKLGREIWSVTMKILGDSMNWLWNSVIQPVVNAIGVAWNWLYANVIHPVASFMVAELKGIATVFTWLWDNIIKPVADFISTAVHVIGATFSVVFPAIGNTIRGAFSGVVDFVRGIFNGIIDVVNGVIGKINGVLSAGKAIGINVQLPTIPHFAGGGVMPHTGYAVVGERGPEIVKLPGGSQVYKNGTGPGGSDGVTVNIEHFNAGNQSPYEIGAELGWRAGLQSRAVLGVS